MNFKIAKQNSDKIQSKFSQNSVKMQSKCSQNAVNIRSKYSQNAANAEEMQSIFSQTTAKIQTKFSQNQSKFSQKPCLSKKLRCSKCHNCGNKNVPIQTTVQAFTFWSVLRHSSFKKGDHPVGNFDKDMHETLRNLLASENHSLPIPSSAYFWVVLFDMRVLLFE